MGPLKEAIIEIWDAGGRRFGFRKVWSKLAGDPKYGPFAGTVPCRVRKCMSGPGMRGICPDASKRTTVPDRDASARPGLIGRDFPGPVPTTEPVGGMAHLRTTGGSSCLAVAMDLCTRMVVGWRLRDNMRAGLVAAAPGWPVRADTSQEGPYPAATAEASMRAPGPRLGGSARREALRGPHRQLP